jgi:hypothetical protein
MPRLAQEDGMKLELSSLSGQPVCKDLWRSAPDISVDYLDDLIRDELLSFYDGNDHVFWPKPQYGQSVPEVVQILDDDGELLIKYDVNDLAQDTGRKLAGPVAPGAATGAESGDQPPR